MGTVQRALLSWEFFPPSPKVLNENNEQNMDFYNEI